jgi:hypothetical protein
MQASGASSRCGVLGPALTPDACLPVPPAQHSPNTSESRNWASRMRLRRSSAFWPNQPRNISPIFGLRMIRIPDWPPLPAPVQRRNIFQKPQHAVTHCARMCYATSRSLDNCFRATFSREPSRPRSLRRHGPSPGPGREMSHLAG